MFNTAIQEALDEIAPIRSFKVRSHHKFGLSEQTKDLMRKRDYTRAGISKASPSERPTLLKKYKFLRNQVIGSIRKDSLMFNDDRIAKANDEKEMWNVVREVTNPKKNSAWTINTESGPTNDEKIIADTFNSYFVTKIEELKKGICRVNMTMSVSCLVLEVQRIPSSFDYSLFN